MEIPIKIPITVHSNKCHNLLTIVILIFSLFCNVCHSHFDLASVCGNICTKLPSMAEETECLVSCASFFYRLENGDDGNERGLSEYMEENSIYPEKRQKSSFVRIGKGKSSFVRVGRSVDNLIEKLQDINDQPRDEAADADKRMSSFVRIGKSDPEFLDSELDKRMSSFVRIGKSYDPMKRASSFVRIGRAGRKYLFKRPSSFVRIGKKSLYSGGPKRMSSFVRIGKSLPENEYFSEPPMQEDKRLSSFVRIGKAAPSSFVRIGRSGEMNDAEIEKRMSNFVRIGRDMMDNKRASSFVRIGRPNYKRLSSFVRIGKKSDYNSDLNDSEFNPSINPEQEMEGNELDQVISDNNKRYSSFVRIGKKSSDNSPGSYSADDSNLDDTMDKRASSFVRIGKSYSGDGGDQLHSKRLSSFVRIGKRGGEGVAEDNDQLAMENDAGVDDDATSQH